MTNQSAIRLFGKLMVGGAGFAIVAIAAGPWLLESILYPSTPEKLTGADWQPGKFRPRQEQALPPSAQVAVHQTNWLASNTNSISRIYAARLGDPSRQSDFKVEYKEMDSPLGQHWWTYASFRYSDTTNGSYIFTWRQLGRHKPDFLKLDATPRLFWLGADQIGFRDGSPVLEVIGIEGVTKFCSY